jgi:hypothetical protein
MASFHANFDADQAARSIATIARAVESHRLARLAPV